MEILALDFLVILMRNNFNWKKCPLRQLDATTVPVSGLLVSCRLFLSIFLVHVTISRPRDYESLAWSSLHSFFLLSFFETYEVAIAPTMYYRIYLQHRKLYISILKMSNTSFMDSRLIILAPYCHSFVSWAILLYENEFNSPCGFISVFLDFNICRQRFDNSFWFWI